MRGRELMGGVGKTMMQSGGTFGTFMAIGMGIRCWGRTTYRVMGLFQWLQPQRCVHTFTQRISLVNKADMYPTFLRVEITLCDAEALIMAST